MPTFETEVPAKPAETEKIDEFRPRKRGEWQGPLDETFDPAPIPPEVKQSINKRVNDMIRQSSGPDETMYAIREWFSTARKVLVSLPSILKDMILRRKEEDDANEDEIEEEEEAEEESENNSSDAKQISTDNQYERRRRRSHRGGRRRHGRSNGDYHGDRSPDREDRPDAE
jgi:hypothetical protein